MITHCISPLNLRTATSLALPDPAECEPTVYPCCSVQTEGQNFQRVKDLETETGRGASYAVSSTLSQRALSPRRWHGLLVVQLKNKNLPIALKYYNAVMLVLLYALYLICLFPTKCTIKKQMMSLRISAPLLLNECSLHIEFRLNIIFCRAKYNFSSYRSALPEVNNFLKSVLGQSLH